MIFQNIDSPKYNLESSNYRFLTTARLMMRQWYVIYNSNEAIIQKKNDVFQLY